MNEITGGRELEDALRGTASALRGEFKAGMVDTAGMIVRAAKGRVPQRTGKAANSLGVEVEDEAATIVAGGRTAPYFHILEFGSKTVRGGHYLGTAIEASADDIEKAALEAFVRAARSKGLSADG